MKSRPREQPQSPTTNPRGLGCYGDLWTMVISINWCPMNLWHLELLTNLCVTWLFTFQWMSKHGVYFTVCVFFRQGEGSTNKLFHVKFLSKATASKIFWGKKNINNLGKGMQAEHKCNFFLPWNKCFGIFVVKIHPHRLFSPVIVLTLFNTTPRSANRLLSTLTS